MCCRNSANRELTLKATSITRVTVTIRRCLRFFAMTKKKNHPQSAATPGASTSTATGPISSTLVAPDPITQPHTGRTIALFYWILDVSSAASLVDIGDNRTVGHLKKEIVKDKPGALANVDADELTLWKVSGFPPLSLI